MMDNRLISAMRDTLSGRNGVRQQKSVSEQYTETYVGPIMAICTAVGLIPIIVKTIKSFKAPNNNYTNN